MTKDQAYYLVMTNIAARHWYRFGYLKSEHWQNMRLTKLASARARCYRCLKVDDSNDVHHLSYRNIYDVDLSDLVVLCRECHTKFHEVLERNKEDLMNLTDSGEILRRCICLIRISEGKSGNFSDHWKEMRHNGNFAASPIPKKNSEDRLYRQEEKLTSVYQLRLSDSQFAELQRLPRWERLVLLNDIRRLISDRTSR